MTGAQHVVGVDIGGTKTAAALIDREGTIVETATVSTPALDGADAIVAGVLRLIGRFSGSRTVAAVGVGTAGVVDTSTGTIVAGNDTFADWVGTPLRDRLAAELGVPVHVENDVDAHLAGEAWVGAARGASHALLVAIGTGVGAGLLVDGRQHRGAHHAAGEMGHMPSAAARGLRCPCGTLGHLEAIAAGPAIHRAYLAAGGDPSCGDARGVAERSRSGEALARSVIDRAAHAVGIALAQIATVLDPEVIVLGGSVALSGEHWWSRVEEDLREQLIEQARPVRLVPSQLGSDAPLIGAAAGAWRMIGDEMLGI